MGGKRQGATKQRSKIARARKQLLSPVDEDVEIDPTAGKNPVLEKSVEENTENTPPKKRQSSRRPAARKSKSYYFEGGDSTTDEEDSDSEGSCFEEKATTKKDPLKVLTASPTNKNKRQKTKPPAKSPTPKRNKKAPLLPSPKARAMRTPRKESKQSTEPLSPPPSSIKEITGSMWAENTEDWRVVDAIDY